MPHQSLALRCRSRAAARARGGPWTFEAGRTLLLALCVAARGGAHVIHPLDARIAVTSRAQTAGAHPVAEAGVLGWLAGRTGPIAPWRASRLWPKRRQAGPIGSASAWSGTHSHRQPEWKGTLARLGIRRFQTNPAQGGGSSCNTHTPEGSRSAEFSPSCQLIWRALVVVSRSRDRGARQKRLEQDPRPSHPRYDTWLGSSASSSKR